MYKCILVVLDGTLGAERALAWVRQLARCSHAGVHLLMVHPPAKTVISGGHTVAYAHQIDESVRSESLAYLEHVAAELRADGITVRTDARVGGAEAVRATAREIGADLIAIAPTPPRGLRRLLALGFTPRILREPPGPVLVAGPRSLRSA